jgi:hypothetical protein
MVGAVPFPLSVTIWLVDGALSRIVRAPVSDPVFEGRNATEIWHEADGASELPHVFVSGKSAEELMLLIVSATVLGFVSVTIEGALFVPWS